MPTVAIYIRKANLQKYLSMENPSAWLNAILANTEDVSEYGAVKDLPAVGPAVTVLKEVLKPWEQALEDEAQRLTRKTGLEHWRVGRQIYVKLEDGSKKLVN